jgi:hypothetical protein
VPTNVSGGMLQGQGKCEQKIADCRSLKPCACHNPICEEGIHTRRRDMVHYDQPGGWTLAMYLGRCTEGPILEDVV